MPLFGEIFLSEFVGKSLLDPKGESCGRVRDVIAVKGDPLPRIAAIIVELKRQLYRVEWEEINLLNRKIISTYLNAGSLAPYAINDYDLLLVRDVLDKQIVDANGAKVVRVNDIKLEGYNGEAALVAVDMGIRGILRRLNSERRAERLLRLFQMTLPYNLLSWDYIQPLKPKLKTIALTVPRKLISDLHPADIAEIISRVPRDEGANFLKDLDVETAAETLSELKPEVQADMISSMEASKAADILEEMSPDKAADVLGDLPEEKTTELLGQIEKEEALDIKELLSHEEDTAGGIMTNEFIAYPPDITVKESIERFKKDALEIESIHYIFVIDGEDRLVGVTTLKGMLLADPSARLSDIMETKLITVAPGEDEMTVAATISKYNLVAVPVVDGKGTLLGIAKIDDVIDRILPPAAKRGRRAP